jgi:hypothetical protein
LNNWSRVTPVLADDMKQEKPAVAQTATRDFHKSTVIFASDVLEQVLVQMEDGNALESSNYTN